MTTLYVKKPTAQEEKFQSRLGTMELGEYVKISADFDGNGDSRVPIGFDSLILLEFPCELEDILSDYQGAVSDGMMHIWILLKNDGAVLRKGNDFLISRTI